MFNQLAITVYSPSGIILMATISRPRSTYGLAVQGSHTELRSARNFEAHGTSKRTELRNARNFENVFEALMYLIIPEPII